MIIFWMSEVPSPMSMNLTSRISRSISYSLEYEIERLMREVKFMLIGEGTSDIQKMIIGRSLLKDYQLR